MDMGQGEVLRVLKPKHWKKVKEIMDETGIQRRSVNQSLVRLEKQNFVEKKSIGHRQFVWRSVSP